MGHRYIDLMIVSALAAIAVVPILIGVDNAILRLPFALLLTFVLPGYALTAAILGRAPMSLERSLYTLGLSLMTAILGGLVLNGSPWGLRAETWASLLAIITISASFLAFVRRPAAATAPAQPFPRPKLADGILFGLAAVVIVGAILMASSAAAQYPSTEVVQLWMLPGDKLDSGAVKVGVSNKTTAPMTCRLVLQQGNSILVELPAIVIPAGGTWETAAAPSGVRPNAGPIEAFLYRSDAPAVPYRHVLMWLNTQGQ